MTYALSTDFVSRLVSRDFSDLLFPFANTQRPQLKIANDKESVLIRYYEKIIDSNYKELYSSWLSLMNMHRETAFAMVEVDLTSTPCDRYCLKVAALVRGQKKVIIRSLQDTSLEVFDDGCVEYEGHRIPVIERDNAIKEVNESNITNIIVENSRNVKINNKSNNR